MCERGSTLVRARQHAKGDIAITPGMGLGSNGPAKVRGLGGRSAHRGGQADHDHARMTRFKRRGGSRPEYNGGVAKGRPQVTCSGARGDGHLSRPSEGAWHRGGEVRTVVAKAIMITTAKSSLNNGDPRDAHSFSLLPPCLVSSDARGSPAHPGRFDTACFKGQHCGRRCWASTEPDDGSAYRQQRCAWELLSRN